MPQQELDLFDKQVERARDLVGTAAALNASLTGAVDVSDLYRAAYVQAVSALDTFIHSDVRARMLATFPTDSHTQAFDRFRVSLSSVQVALATQGDLASQLNWLDAEIQDQHSYLSFQQPDKIADAIRLVSNVRLWDALALSFGQAAMDGESGAKILKRRLTLMVDRRNTIVHESDLNPTPPGDRLYPMTRATAEDAIDFVERLVHEIYALI